MGPRELFTPQLVFNGSQAEHDEVIMNMIRIMIIISKATLRFSIIIIGSIAITIFRIIIIGSSIIIIIITSPSSLPSPFPLPSLSS